jgi:hypothetical protein
MGMPTPMQTLPDRPSILDRVSVFAHHWQFGARHGIPRCCRAHFCFDQALGRVAGVVRWRQIGTWRTRSSDRRWVPCGIRHAGYSRITASRRTLRIVAFNLAVLLPGRRAEWLRARAKTPGPAWLDIDLEGKCRLSRGGHNGQLWWAHGLRVGERVRA